MHSGTETFHTLVHTRQDSMFSNCFHFFFKLCDVPNTIFTTVLSFFHTNNSNSSKLMENSSFFVSFPEFEHMTFCA